MLIEPLEARRHLSTGRLDKTFSGDGSLLVNLRQAVGPGAGTIRIADLDVDSSDRIYITATASRASTQSFRIIIARIKIDGAIDTSYANNGFRVFNKAWNTEAPKSFLDTKNRLLLVNQGYDLSVTRLTPSGKNDKSFGVNGVKETNYRGMINDMVIHGDEYLAVGSNGYPGFHFADLFRIGVGAGESFSSEPPFSFEFLVPESNPEVSGERVSSAVAIHEPSLLIEFEHQRDRELGAFDADYPQNYQHLGIYSGVALATVINVSENGYWPRAVSNGPFHEVRGPNYVRETDGPWNNSAVRALGIDELERCYTLVTEITENGQRETYNAIDGVKTGLGKNTKTGKYTLITGRMTYESGGTYLAETLQGLARIKGATNKLDRDFGSGGFIEMPSAYRLQSDGALVAAYNKSDGVLLRRIFTSPSPLARLQSTSYVPNTVGQFTITFRDPDGIQVNEMLEGIRINGTGTADVESSELLSDGRWRVRFNFNSPSSSIYQVTIDEGAVRDQVGNGIREQLVGTIQRAT